MGKSLRDGTENGMRAILSAFPSMYLRALTNRLFCNPSDGIPLSSPKARHHDAIVGALTELLGQGFIIFQEKNNNHLSA